MIFLPKTEENGSKAYKRPKSMTVEKEHNDQDYEQ